MAKVRKTIGRVPVYRGDFVEGTVYYLYNIVGCMGSSFICNVESTTNVPCVVEDGVLKVQDGWGFFADASFGVKLINQREDDIDKDTFEAMKLAGTLDPNKRYFIYEE